MANKYEKGEFEEYFHVNPKFSRTGPDMLRTEKQAAGIAGKTDRLYRFFSKVGFRNESV